MRGSHQSGAAAQRAVAVPGRGRGRGGGVADGSVGAVQSGVHAVGRAVTGRDVTKGRVVQTASRQVNGAQDRPSVRDFRKRGQHIGKVVIVVWRGKKRDNGVN